MSFVPAFLETRNVPTTDTSRAFSVPPSQVWDGNDGAWSTFIIRVGSPPQYFRILPSTNSAETWVPIPDKCERGRSWCGNARGVAPFNAGTSGPASGSPTGISLGSLDAGYTCTANKSPMCRTCVSIEGKCTDGPCVGRTCCGDNPGECNSGGCDGVSGICTAAYIGCPCPGPDYNAGLSAPATPSAANPLNAAGFLANASSTWTSKGTHWTGAEAFLNETAQGQYGIDTVGVGPDAGTGLTSDGNVVAGIPATPYYLGTLGMKPSNSSGPDGSYSSFITQLAAQNKIPSLSYGYSAGALYKQNPVLGSLTLGGYDASRLVPSNVTFPIPMSKELSIPIHSITATEALLKNATLLSENITALIDTTTPHSWLPRTACRAFETTFGLTWDESTQLYLVNDTTHQRLTNQNPSVTISFGSAAISNQQVNITLPYAAFDLQASKPIYPNGTNYFPLRRAATPSQYTIGRALFQEAYLIVDYETSNFSISQAQYPVPATSNIVTIGHKTPAISSSPLSPQNPQQISRGAIAGTAIGASAAFILLCSLAFFFLRRRRSSSSNQQQEIPKNPSMSSSEGGTGAIATGHLNPTNSQMSSPKNNTTSTESSPYTARSTLNPPELEDPTSQSNISNPQGQSSMPATSKPLPRTPQELAGCDAVDELMQTSGQATPRSKRRQVSDTPSVIAATKRVKHIYEMIG